MKKENPINDYHQIKNTHSYYNKYNFLLSIKKSHPNKLYKSSNN